MTADEYLLPVQARMEEMLDLFLPPADLRPEQLHRAMRYAVLGGGKRLRAGLIYASGGLFGASQELLDYPAAAVELIHAYSLVHDDLPAMDDDDLRRGKPSCHRAFDEATAILVGDALQSVAFQVLLRCREAGVADGQIVVMIGELAKATGSVGMAGGQYIDLNAVKQAGNFSLGDLEDAHRRKTGALIRASVLLGATAAGANDKNVLAALGEFGDRCGLGFQIHDDILDHEADTLTLGKPRGSDARRGMPTHVSLLGLEPARERARVCRDAALAAIGDLGPAAEPLRVLANYSIERRH